MLAPYQGRCLGVGQLNALLKAVTDHYLDRGYVTTRAYLPQQDLASGTLRIIVVEGRLEGLDSSTLASPRELAMSFPGRTGELLDLRELEQLVDQLSRLPSRQAQLELVPGSEVGGSRVRLKGERDKPWRVSATRNNDGDVSTGEQQMGLGLDWDSPLGLADQLNLRANRDAVTDRWRHSDSQSLFYSLPWGWWTFTYGYSQSDYRTRNEASGFPFKLDGDSRSHQFRAERVLHRDGVSKTAMSLGLSHQRTNNYVEDTRLEDQSTRITETQLGFNHGRRIGSGFVNLDLGWQQGIGALGAQGRGHPQAGDPNARYDKYSLTLSYLQPFQLWGERFSFDSLATGQRSEDVLFSPAAHQPRRQQLGARLQGPDPDRRQRRLLAQPVALAARGGMGAAAALAAGIRRGLRLRRRRDPPRPLQRRRQRAHERQRHRTGCPRPLFRRQRRLRPLAGAAQRHRAARAPDLFPGRRVLLKTRRPPERFRKAPTCIEALSLENLA
ncbi:putative hemolysin activation/secretion protein [Pseudomonas aeruginosa]|nr:putative hemolysin activation/secretion protein [Pseudomonas aeruginosa]